MSPSTLPPPVERRIDAFSSLPGIGPKTASRLACYLLRAPEKDALELAEALQDLKARIILCSRCFNISEAPLCTICADPARDDSILCVVEEPLDIVALERTHEYRGRYHVLHGSISPVEGIGPEDLKIEPLMERLRQGEVQEVILATNPNLEGEVTADYIARQVMSLGIRVTRLARGLPVGGDLEYADEITLSRALQGRREM